MPAPFKADGARDAVDRDEVTTRAVGEELLQPHVCARAQSGSLSVEITRPVATSGRLSATSSEGSLAYMITFSAGQGSRQVPLHRYASSRICAEEVQATWFRRAATPAVDV
eukprot:4670639-Heterocapsa_arctica.AAC.1